MMMSMRVLLGVALGVLLFMGVGSATFVLNANPIYVKVPAGGSNYTTISIEDTANNSYMAVYYNINNPNVTGSLAGPYLDSNFTVSTPATKSTAFSTTGQINWTGTAGTVYYFKLTFTSTQAGQTFQTAVTGASVNVTPVSITINLAGTVVSGSVVPELITAILVGAGLVSVVLWRRWI